MPKNKKKVRPRKNASPPVEETPTPENSTPEKQRPTLTAQEKKALFKAYDAACDAVTAAEQAVLDRKSDKSDAVRAIYDALGEGPFEWKGEDMVIRKREGTFYFKGREIREVERIG